MRRKFSLVLVLLVGCGEETNDAPTPSDEEQIADAANQILESFETGDAASCELLTRHGQRVILRVVNNAGFRAETCSEAIEVYAHEARRRLGASDARPQVVMPDEVEVRGSGTAASAASDFRGAMRFRKVDDTWLASLPVFSD